MLARSRGVALRVRLCAVAPCPVPRVTNARAFRRRARIAHRARRLTQATATPAHPARGTLPARSPLPVLLLPGPLGPAQTRRHPRGADVAGLGAEPTRAGCADARTVA